MSRKQRTLTPEEAALWARVAETVAPISENGKTVRAAEHRAQPARAAISFEQSLANSGPSARKEPGRSQQSHAGQSAALLAPQGGRGLDSSWDKKLARGTIHPDFTLDLHGASLDAAYGRLMHGMVQAKAMGARIVLLITGKPRPVEAADRGQRRGAIRAKVMDWLAHSEHALDIAAVRNAHRRHGGQGALYIVLKRR